MKLSTKSLQRLIFVRQTKTKVLSVWEGYESMTIGALTFGKLKLNKRDVVKVFDLETEEYLGYLSKTDDIIIGVHKAEGWEARTHFADHYSGATYKGVFGE